MLSSPFHLASAALQDVLLSAPATVSMHPHTPTGVNRGTPVHTARSSSSSSSAAVRQGENGAAQSPSGFPRSLPTSIVPAGPLALDADVRTDAPEVVVLAADANAAVSHVAYALSDVTCVFAPEVEAVLLTAWAAKGGMNAFGERGQTKLLQTRAGAGVVANVDSLKHMGPAVGQLRDARLPAVIHVVARRVDADGSASNALETALAVARRAGAPLLVSSSPQEAHDVAVLAHAAALTLRTPVIHAYEDAGVASVAAHVRLLRYSELVRVLDADLLAAHRRLADAANAKPQALALSRGGTTRTLTSVLRGVSPVLAHAYSVAQYHGHDTPDVVFVAVGVAGLLAVAALADAQLAGARAGVLRVTAPLGGLNGDIVTLIPASASTVVALISGTADEAQPTSWQQTVSSVVAYAERQASVSTWRVPTPSYATIVAGMQVVSSSGLAALSASALFPTAAGVSRFAIFGLSGDATHAVTQLAFNVGAELRGATAASADVKRIAQGDAYVTAARVTAFGGTGAPEEVQALLSDGDDIIVIGHASVPSRVSTLAALKPRGKVVIAMEPEPAPAPGAPAPLPLAQRVAALFNPAEVAILIARRAQVFVLAPGAVAARFGLEGAFADLPLAVALFVVAGASSFVYTARTLEQHLKRVLPLEQHAVISRLFTSTKQGLSQVVLTQDAGGLAGAACVPEAPRVDTGRVLPSVPRFNTRVSVEDAHASTGLGPTEWRDTRGSTLATTPLAAAAKDAAYAREQGDAALRSVLFPEAYDSVLVPRADGTAAAPTPLSRTAAVLRPALPAASGHGSEVLYTPVVSVNKRLTPLDYDRNVFHIEFDITGTGLQYSIGSALAVYAANNDADTLDFLNFYGMSPDDYVSLPSSTDGGAPTTTSRQSAFRAFKREVDILGQPNKDFYEALASYATLPAERELLALIASDAGTEEFTARATEAYTYADVLREFASAHPCVADLVRILPRIKPRHYSIASSQRMHPTSVHLLVVEVAWRTPNGRTCSGQCSHYLANLQVGEHATVAVIASEMHLPTDPLAPVIMAGLGTGMAPFRAFIQERAALRAAGYAVGPMALYFGARHRSKEYLYGSELDAYAAQGIIMMGGLRLAFSRDTAHKVYIQHLMKQDGPVLWSMLQEKKGAFYLCGPTWPEPDVEDAITTSFVEHGHRDVAGAKALIKQMKDAKRYVLEVY